MISDEPRQPKLTRLIFLPDVFANEWFDMKVSFKQQLTPGIRRWTCRVVLATVILSAGFSNAQDSRHYLIRGDEPPGLAAQKMVLSNPRLAHVQQPVQVVVPDGALISVWMGGGFGANFLQTVTAQMEIGPVYRFKVSSIPRIQGQVVNQELYPSIELLNKLNPPEDLQQQFPVVVTITLDDLAKALAGKLVTKVIYLEDPETALPFRQMENDQQYFDVGPTEDPMRTAERMGRPMAILRIGSRVPDFVSDVEFQMNPGPAQVQPGVPQVGGRQIDVSDDIGFEEMDPIRIPDRTTMPPQVPARDLGAVPTGIRR